MEAASDNQQEEPNVEQPPEEEEEEVLVVEFIEVDVWGVDYQNDHVPDGHEHSLEEFDFETPDLAEHWLDGVMGFKRGYDKLLEANMSFARAWLFGVDQFIALYTFQYVPYDILWRKAYVDGWVMHH